ncbi:MAG: zinc ribbon domain-containing protein [Phycisphaerales bacterium]|nr:zinc ribbon domain-containing protein [Phycisphaerales bacterium]
MPLYEYVCEQDGEVIELLRPRAEADTPVPDPQGGNRTFVRKQSTFAAKGIGGAHVHAPGGCCPCGKNTGGCGSMN